MITYAQTWGDGGHIGQVFRERGVWVWALIHVPTGEILCLGRAWLRCDAVAQLRACAKRRGLQVYQHPRLRLWPWRMRITSQERRSPPHPLPEHPPKT